MSLTAPDCDEPISRATPRLVRVGCGLDGYRCRKYAVRWLSTLCAVSPSSVTTRSGPAEKSPPNQAAANLTSLRASTRADG